MKIEMKINNLQNLLGGGLKDKLNLKLKTSFTLGFFALAFFVFGLGFGKEASATTYYVSPTGSNTFPYDTWAKAALLLSTIFAGFDMTPGDIIEMDGGSSGISYLAAGTGVIIPGPNEDG